MKRGKKLRTTFIEEIFDKHYKEIYSFVFLRTGYRKELAEDLTSEIFIKLFENIEKYDDRKGKLSTWIFQIARNHIIDYFRKKKVASVDIDKIYNLKSDDDDFVYVEKELLNKYIFKYIKMLTAQERDLIFLRYTKDFSIKEISVITKLTESNIKVKLHRTINKLKKMIKNDER